MKANLTKAMRAEFFYQAIFIEYAIIEDRTLSALKHAGVKTIDKRGNNPKLSAKLNKMRSNPAFTAAYVRKRIPLDLIDEIEVWKRDRDHLIHALATIPYDHESIREIAERGQRLVKVIDSRVKSVNAYYDKQNALSK